MAILRLILVLVAAVLYQYGITPPNAKPPTEQLRGQHGGIEHMLSLVVLTMRTALWFWVSLEGTILFALSEYCPPALARPFRYLLPTTLTSDPTALTPAFLTGALLTIAGSLLRAYCFRALGPRFTFELSIRPTHTLVTDGVYAIVRHPSYTGLAALWMGCVACLLDPQGPVVCVLRGLLQAHLARVGGDVSDEMVLVGVMSCMWATAVYLMYLVLGGRMKSEDTMLEQNFGDEWRAWVKKVPYRMVPRVY